MKMLPKSAPIEERSKQYEEIFLQELRKANWVNSQGKLKKTIPFKVRNMTIENIGYRIEEIEGELTVVLEFDAHYKTEKQEAILHKVSYWDMTGEPSKYLAKAHYAFEYLNQCIRKQLVFTDRIDMNIFNYNGCEKLGWKIIKK